MLRNQQQILEQMGQEDSDGRQEFDRLLGDQRGNLSDPYENEGGYYYDDFIDLPYPTLKAARKRTNYVRLAKKGANYVRLAKKDSNFGKFSDLYDNIQYDEI